LGGIQPVKGCWQPLRCLMLCAIHSRPPFDVLPVRILLLS
jgi:hypothetical protein